MNVVDSLIITLGLDPSDFTKGQKEVAASFAKTKDVAVKSAKDVEKSGKDMAEALGKATQGVLTLAAAFLGGKGIKEFIGDASKANTSLGNLSASLGTSPQLISAFSMAAARMGGSAGAAQASIQSLSDTLVDLRTEGKALPEALFQLEAKSGKNIDFQHGWEKLTVGLADAANTLAKTDPAAADRFLRQLGIDPTTAQLLIQQGPRMQAYLAMLKKYAPNDRDIAASRGMTDAWGQLNDQFGNLATKIGTAIAPMLEWLADKIGNLVDWMSKWVEANPKWTDAIVGFIGLFSAGSILVAIKNILGLASALTALSAANGLSAGAGFLGLLARLGIVGAGAAAMAAVLNPTDLNDGEDEISRQKRYGRGSGNDALRRRRSHDKDIDLGSPGKLSANQQEAFRAAKGEGLSDKAARALVADLSGEGLPRDAHRVHWDGKHFAHGIAQWDDDRSAKIKAHYGKAPEELSVADQTRAAIWEINNNPRFARTKRALQGDNAGAMLGELVRNYEAPKDIGGAIAARSKIYSGLGRLAGAQIPGGAAHAAALSNIANDHRVTTSSSSNEMHIGNINVNAPQATDAHGIARHIDSALAQDGFARMANYGPY